ncbi:MAG: response regulator [Nitrospirae bacterium]|nr:response regulator [Nitrospirota bacterium]
MNLVIVEDSELIQTQLLRLVSLHGGINVVGIADDEETAVSLIASSNPDAVLLDLVLEPGSGIHVLERIRKAGCTSPKAHWLMLRRKRAISPKKGSTFNR